MKRVLITICFTATVFTFVVPASAQSAKSILSTLKNVPNTTARTQETAISSTIGGDAVKNAGSSSTLIGTWVYKKPEVKLKSSNLLGKMGGSLASNKMEDEIAAYLEKAGITPGKFKLTFNSDSTFTTTLNGKNVSGKYSLDGSMLTFMKDEASDAKVTATAKVGRTLELTFNADKLLALVQELGSMAKSEKSTLSTIISFSKNYSGMQIGMQFSK